MLFQIRKMNHRGLHCFAQNLAVVCCDSWAGLKSRSNANVWAPSYLRCVLTPCCRPLPSLANDGAGCREHQGSLAPGNGTPALVLSTK